MCVCVCVGGGGGVEFQNKQDSYVKVIHSVATISTNHINTEIYISALKGKNTTLDIHK